MQNTQQCVCHMPEAWSIEYIRGHWQKIEKQAQISFFQSWPWMDAWLTVARKDVRPVLFKVDNKVVGISFVGTGCTKDHRILSFSTLVPWGTGHHDIDVAAPEYNAPLTVPGYEKAVRGAMISFLLSDPRFAKMPRIDMRRIPVNHYDDYKSDAYHYDIYKTEKSFSLSLSALRDAENDISTLISKGAHSQIKQSLRHYEETYGTVTYERPENATKAQNWFAELGKLNQKRFNNKNQKGIWDYPKLVNMHRALLDRYFDKGIAEVVRVRAGEKTIGYLYNFLFRGRVYYYMGGFVYQTDNKLRPGMVTHYHAILNYAKNDDLGYYDFLAGDQPYKKRLSNETTEMINFTITRSTFKLCISRKISCLRNIFRKKPKNNA